ncbi:MAG: single-stranded-DNA-specific exonuclease RecJ [Nannocystaceae bacterium]
MLDDTPRLRRRGESFLRQVDVDGAAGELGVSPRTVELLAARGVVDGVALRRALSPRLGDLRPPTSMAGFEAAVDLICTARAKNRRIGVFGDYDVDGVASAAVLTESFETVGLDVVSRVASREDGYGFTVGAAQRLCEAGAQVVVVGDCGTSDHEALGWLLSRGIESIVIDHHQVPAEMPPAAAFINPHREDCVFPFKGLCSAGVAFYLGAALRTAVRRREPSVQVADPRVLLDLVALATVCDMVPLVAENRVLTHHGLRMLGARRRPGIESLLARAKVPKTRPIDEEHVGFQLGPRLNAAGRLGSAQPALDLLRSRSPAEAGPLSDRLEALNTRRRLLQLQVVEQAERSLAEDPALGTGAAIVLADARWAHGVVGIAAAGLVARFRRPVAVLAVDRGSAVARGSVRSVTGVDVHAALATCSGLLTRFGGHAAAAGFSMPAHGVDAFRRAFAEAVQRQREAGAAETHIEEHDGALELAEVGSDLLAAVDAARPYGIGFTAPQFLMSELRVAARRTIKQQHVALTLQRGPTRVEAIWFGSTAVGLEVGDRVSGLFAPAFDTYRNRVQLRVRSLWREPA